MRRKRVVDNTPPLVRWAKRWGPVLLVLGLIAWLIYRGISWTPLAGVVVGVIIFWRALKMILTYHNFKGDRKTGRCGVRERKFVACSRYEQPTMMGTCGHQDDNFCALLKYLRRRQRRQARKPVAAKAQRLPIRKLK